MAKQFSYVGDGLGVAGLPHQITDAEAEALGLAELLAAAIAQGTYRESAPAGDFQPAGRLRQSKAIKGGE